MSYFKTTSIQCGNSARLGLNCCQSMMSMDPEFQFLVNYHLLAMKNESLFWFMPIDYFGHEDLVEVVQSCPSHSLTIVTYYDGMEPLLELVRPHVKIFPGSNLESLIRSFD